ncbi:MAG: CDGSH iron-sulfur domain-containing protein [Candidatus Pacearchaeota archaeon]|nr:CDGSH iron-sulfur domain-containing protein [Candidatus Pacearchaeota archaeon]
MEKEKIIISKDGPYLVSGKVRLKKEAIVCDNQGFPIRWEKGKEYDVTKDYALCRCGHSCNKPFCDKTHIKTNFDGKETAKKSYVNDFEKIEGPELELNDYYDLCASARFCKRLGGIWELTKKSGNPEAKKTAIQQACDCPSGRLVMLDKKTDKIIEPNFGPSISATEDPYRKIIGPLWVKGKIQVDSADGGTYEKRNRVTLCRCGKSKNKPFCDGAHVEINFNEKS